MDKITLDKEIGRGGFGKVYLGRYHGGSVAVKQIPTKERDAIDKEILMLATLQSHYCVRFFGWCEKDGDAFLITEMCDLGDLRNVLRKNPDIDELSKLKICRDIANGIGFLHTRNVTHRDLKPDNVLIRSLHPQNDIFTAITDFGISKQATDQMLTDQTMMAGTPVYMAPGMKFKFNLQNLNFINFYNY